MEGFDISKINLKNSKEPSVEEKLTGSVISNLKDKDVEPNVELEGKEYLRFPDGEITRAEGEDHGDKSGIKMYLPDGTTILSNSMKVSSSDAKRLSKDFDVKIRAGVTYAEAQEAYRKKIGIAKLDKEQEEAIVSLRKTMEKETDENTKRVNEDFLKNKIGEIEQSKAALQPEYGQFFQSLFDLQESKTKPKDDTKEYKYGGLTKNNLNRVLEKYGLTEDELLGAMSDEGNDKFLDGGTIGNFENGGEVEKLRKQIREGTITGPEAQREMNKLKAMGQDVSDIEPQVEYLLERSARVTMRDSEVPGLFRVGYQPTNEAAFGPVGEEQIDDVVRSWYINFPDITSKNIGAVREEDGKITYSDLAFNTDLEEVYGLQEGVKSRYQSNRDYMKSRPDLYTDQQIQEAEEFVEKNTFDGSKGRESDKRVGGFTATRANMELGILTPEEVEKSDRDGVYTTRQLQKKLEEDPNYISEESAKRLNDYIGEAPEDVDFRLSTFNRPVAQVTEEVYVIGERKDKASDTKVPKSNTPEDDIIAQTRKRFPRAFAHMDMRPLPPSPMEAHLKGETRLERIDPIRVGTQNVEQQIANQMSAVMTQIEALPPSQRASVMASLQATAGQSLNQGIMQANQINAQNQSSAELFNIGQSAQEQQANLANALSYEKRQMMAKSNTEEDTRRYYDRLQSIALNEMQNNQRLNMLDQMSDNYSLNLDGTGVTFDSNSQWGPNDTQKLMRLAMQLQQENTELKGKK